jgi:hypothetical protein
MYSNNYSHNWKKSLIDTLFRPEEEGGTWDERAEGQDAVRQESSHTQGSSLKGLSHEKYFKNFDKNLRAA